MKDRIEYWKEFQAKHKYRLAAVRDAWRAANRSRFKATTRLRYLRQKLDPSEGELEQIAELSKKYPPRRSVVPDPDYKKNYYQRNKERLDAKRFEWRMANVERERAHRRLRYLRSKPEPTIREKDMAWVIEQRYPKRKSFWYPSR